MSLREVEGSPETETTRLPPFATSGDDDLDSMMMILLVDDDVVGLAQSMVMPDHATDLLTLLTDLTKEKNLISVDIDEASMIKLDIKINEGRVDRGTTSRSRERTTPICDDRWRNMKFGNLWLRYLRAEHICIAGHLWQK